MEVSINKKIEFKKAVQIGAICIISYLASYFMRNILSVSTPQMVQSGEFTKELIGKISSVYFLTYACGQLINGVVGDKIKGRNMVGTGLLLAGISTAVFPFTVNEYQYIICFAINGFALSMLRGPLVRIISENTLPEYARNCCVGFSVASLCGPLLAGLLAAIFRWKSVFFIAAALTSVMGVFSFLILAHFEKKGVIVENVGTKKENGEKISIFKLFSADKFLIYLLIGALTEVVGAAVTFWIPSYISEHLEFSSQETGVIYSVISVIKALSPFLSMYIFNLLHKKDLLLVKLFFALSAIMFLTMNYAQNRWANIVFLLAALICAGCVSTTLWSIYIPGLRDTGCVSTANGIFDFSGYVFASIANIIFANAVSGVGWTGIIYIWGGMMFFGMAAVMIFELITKNKKSERIDKI